MKNFNGKTIALGFVFILFLILHVKSQSPALQGRITTLTGLPIPNVKLIIESLEYLYKTETDENGYYKTEPPIGIKTGYYKIYTESYIGSLPYKASNNNKYIWEDCQSYFRPTTRANIFIDHQNPLTVNLILIESGELCDWQENSKKIPYGVFAQANHLLKKPKIKYENITRTEDLEIPLDIVIQYGSRIEKNGKVFYSTNIFQPPPSILGEPFPGVVITYNNMTVYAEKAEFEKKKKIIHAAGNVVVEDGKEQFRAKKVEISNINGKPDFDFEK